MGVVYHRHFCFEVFVEPVVLGLDAAVVLFGADASVFHERSKRRFLGVGGFRRGSGVFMYLGLGVRVAALARLGFGGCCFGGCWPGRVGGVGGDPQVRCEVPTRWGGRFGSGGGLVVEEIYG